MSEQNALVLAPVLGREDQDEETTPAVFGEFLRALRSKLRADQQIAIGAVTWCDEPVETILLSGIWVVMQKLANILEESLTTASRAEAIAKRVNRLASAGILFVYGTPQAAADAFHTQVILLVRRARELGYLPGMDVSLATWKDLLAGDERKFARQLPKNHDASKPGSLIAYWQGPCALFFARLVKEARDHSARLAVLKQQIDTGNLIASVRVTDVYAIASGTYASDLMLMVLDYLDETVDSSRAMPDGICAEEIIAQNALAAIMAFRAFRVAPAKLVSRATANVSIDDVWLPTQILLAHSNAPVESEEISGVNEYAQALHAMQSSSSEEVRARAWARLSNRLIRKLTALERCIVDKKINAHLAKMNRWDPDLITDETLDSILIVVSDRDILPDPKTALEIATGEEISPLEQAQSARVDMKAWLFGVASAIVWEHVEEKDALAIVSARVIPAHVVADNLDRCAPKVARACADAIMRRSPSPKVLNKLLKTGLAQITPDLLQTRVVDIEPELLAPHIADLLEQATVSDKSVMNAFWNALGRTTIESARALVDNHARRKQLCVVYTEILSDPDALWETIDRIRENLGEDRHAMLLLGCAASDIDAVRSSSEPKTLPTKWERIFDIRSIVHLPIRVLGKHATREDAKRLLRAVSEKDARKWVGLE